MKNKKYFLVDSDVLPDVFLKVLHAKELLASGEAKNVSIATRSADVSRSAFYKYRDCVFRAETGSGTVTITAVLLDETGALQSLLAGISAAGAGIITINQSIPENGTAAVAVTMRAEDMHIELDDLFNELKKQRTVLDIRQS